MLEKFIFHIGGDICVKLANELEKLKGKEITDQELSELLGEDINTTRKNLYKLLDYNLATYRRVRDKKNGWILFYFRANFDGYQDILVERNKKQIDKWKELLEYEQNNIFYSCAAGCTRLPFDQASDINFRCPNCDEILNFQDNSSKIEEIRRKIEKAEKENEEIINFSKTSAKKRAKAKA
ncbi:MAG: transcription factor E [Promethearchaeota archaeon]